MRYTFILGLTVLVNFYAGAQALRDINYNYLYNPNETFAFRLKTVRTPGGWTTHYKLEVRDSSLKSEDFQLQWQLREALNDKEGKALTADSTATEQPQNSLVGKIRRPVSATAQILTAKIVNTTLKRAWYFFTILDPNYPVQDVLLQRNEVVFNPYIKTGSPVTVSGNGPAKLVSYYGQVFPAAVPAFSESQAKVSRGMVIDSSFTLVPGQEISFPKKGLYLIQKDSSAKEGLAFRVEEDYPRLGKIESLADPLIYICTRQEFERMKLAKGDKKAFDKVILSVTGDKERAKNLIRSYFRRVELANQYFTSYKEGWKTDRGMIYIVFGQPDEVYRFADREVWNYKNSSYKISFNFVKSTTIFDPDNYVLIRERKFQETWYEVIDLWRNARF
jgi:GWxTD domain-containing protein